MSTCIRVLLGSAVLLSLPARAWAEVQAARAAWPLQMDSGSLGLFGAGLVVLALSRRSRRRS